MICTLTKMAASGTPLGYEYVFVDPVPDDFYCKQCSLVARRLTITSCCGESYCNGCIHSTQQDNQPCPGYGQESFETLQHVKYQKKILSLRVHCSLKEKGCGWCGPLEHLDAHLDPDTGDCEFTDTPCPLKCQQKVSKKNLEHHLTKECVKRDYVCPYCSFKASYEIVTDSHWSECKYYPLVCPNRCGVTCERPTMEDHLKICRLQQVECQFKQIGCLEKFSREDLEEHMREKAQTQMATTSVKMQQEFQTKLQEQEGRFEEKQAEFQAKLQEQEGRFEEKQAEFQAKLQEQEGRFEDKQAEFQGRFEEKQAEFQGRFEDKQAEFQGRFEKQAEFQGSFEEKQAEFQGRFEEKQAEFQAKLQEQEGRFEEKQAEFHAKLQEQEARFEEKQAQFQAKLQEQEGRLEEKQAEFQVKLQEQEGRFEEKQAALKQEFEQKQTAQDQEKLSAQEEKFQAKLQELEGRLKENALAQIQALKATEKEEFRRSCGLSWKFTMEGFNEQKAAISKSLSGSKCGWYSPLMYTRQCGYKFCIRIYANGHGDSYGKSVNVELWKMEGEYDRQLKWPVKVKLTLELINHFENGENKICTLTKTYRKWDSYVAPAFLNVPDEDYYRFISHSELSLNPACHANTFLKG